MIEIYEEHSRFNNMGVLDLTLHKYDRDDTECYVFTDAMLSTFWPKKIITDKGIFTYDGNWPYPSNEKGRHHMGYARFTKNPRLI